MSQDYTIQQKDIDTLQQAGVSQPDIDHSRAVAAKALDIARRTHADLDMELVGRGALFHDLGKAKTHDIIHGRIGAEMGEALGLSVAITAIMEKHIRGGLTAEEAMELGLPVKDYTLRRLEERIVIYADRLVDIIHDGIVKISEESEAETQFVEILREIPKYGKNDITLNRYLAYHAEIQGLIAGRIVGVKQLKNLGSREAIILLDVRRKADYEAAQKKIPGAVWRDPELIDEWSANLPKNSQMVIYCARGGSVSQAVSKQLREKGVKVAYLHGGLKAWTDQNEAVE